MASSAQAELSEAPRVFESLKRLRDISRMVLGAIEREDVEEIERLARESQGIIEALQPQMESPHQEARLPEGTSLQLEALARSWRAIVEGLEFRATEVREQLWDLRRTKSKARTFGIEERNPESSVDRDL